ncbi:GTPase Era [Columbia Basin potato purple top phytoplasma]|uniref:GTPase Era n=1 Tax=Columbia Basin potato purple top phytoplasma TaxID=307134 RepID=A0ABT5L863_9MOLU|nr:GTPase Era [Columbia Basin potato purple top phytoplasma]MDC9031869.1 GTPase Era [Columbia Basin potato purple top phytoplasma]
MFKSGFVSMIGKANVGKSTLLNSLLNQKVSIASDKPNTTKHKILGIYNDPNSQIIFVDNPGLIYQRKKILISKVNFVTLKNIEDVKVILFLVNDECRTEDKEILTFFQKYNKNIILVITKIDLFTKKTSIDKIILSYLKHFTFDAVIPLSSIKKQNLNILKENILSLLDKRPPYFSKSFTTNLSKEELILEFIREKIFYYSDKELPHVCSVVLDNIINNEDFSIQMDILISVPKISQRKILIGSNGTKLKKIRLAAQKDIRRFLKKKISLNLWVKVDPKMKNKGKFLFDVIS